MAETIQVSSADEFVQEAVPIEDIDLTDDGAEELWRIWTERYENGAEDDVCVALPSWFADKEFGKERPYLFAQIEYDDPDSGAILFSDARLINTNIVENGVWDHVTMTETLDVLDVSDDNDHIDEQGKVWIPRSLMHIFERTDETSGGSTSFTDIAAGGYDQ